MLAAELARRFEIGAHPLAFRGAGPAEGGVRRIGFATAGGRGGGGVPARAGGRRGRRRRSSTSTRTAGATTSGRGRCWTGARRWPGRSGRSWRGPGSGCWRSTCPASAGGRGRRRGRRRRRRSGAGGSLAGQMLGELASALDWLAGGSRAPIRRGSGSSGSRWGRRSATGSGRWSRGWRRWRISAASRTSRRWWRAGRMTGTGIYLTVPGLLGVASNGEIAGLIAPRPQFVGLGRGGPADAAGGGGAGAGEPRGRPMRRRGRRRRSGCIWSRGWGIRRRRRCGGR